MHEKSKPMALACGALCLLTTGCLQRPYSLEPTGIKSYDAALQKSLSSGKPMLVVVTASWCSSCKLMLADMAQPHVKQAMQRAVPYFIDLDAPRTQELKKRFYGNKGVPELILIKSDGMEMRRQAGWGSGDAFVQWLDGATFFR